MSPLYQAPPARDFETLPNEQENPDEYTIVPKQPPEGAEETTWITLETPKFLISLEAWA